MNKAVLLVEGQGDVLFFEALLRQMDLTDKINVAPPRDFNFDNTVSNFPRLIDRLTKRMITGHISHLGIVADADHTSGGGFNTRWKTLTERLAAHKYIIPQKPPALPATGSIFKNSHGLPPAGLYLMPNHQDNGMLEDMLWQNLHDDEQSTELRGYAEKVIDGLPHQRFSEHHRTKAMLYSWLAWQKRPGQTMDVTVHGQLLDYQRASLAGFLKWLQKVFPFIEEINL